MLYLFVVISSILDYIYPAIKVILKKHKLLVLKIVFFFLYFASITLYLCFIFKHFYITFGVMFIPSPENVMYTSRIMWLLFWLWFIIYPLMGFICFLIAFIYKEVYNTDTLDDGYDIALQNKFFISFMKSYCYYLVSSVDDNGNFKYKPVSILLVMKYMIYFTLFRFFLVWINCPFKI